MKRILTGSILLLLLSAAGDSFGQSNPAFGDNQMQVEPGVFAIYAGDVNQDGFLGVDDVTLVDNDNLAGVIGYVATDINGDGFLGVDDVTIVDNNNLAGVTAIIP